MASSFSYRPMILTINSAKSHLKPYPPRTHFHSLTNEPIPIKFKSFSTFQAPNHLGHFRTSSFPISSISRSASSNDLLEVIDEKNRILAAEERPVKFLFWVIFWASVSLGFFASSGDANAATAAVDSIRASNFGLKVANALRGSGWPDEAVVFALATLPVIELRGAIPVGYWLQLKPALLTVLSILGNMVPVPFIILYLKKFATFVAGKNQAASQLLEMLFSRAKEKAGPVEEFQWLGLMLFVAVPFPGTGAWTGAIIASVLDMPFWSGVSANFVGVVLAGLLVNLLVNLGLKYAVIVGAVLFLISTFMWSILRHFKTSLSSMS
ncbi:OLC1v1028062C1 [Oldenlandia corymbosa var. corymbosa]|uniref:OLC1v1028062C1 n=1 Tax=Oldenlandia corymbosa var. corymbosa TaxID=529605 RepID=A0AAV1CBG4_OLDCO|nr:OLC1v1028062C1 [Oldenlandia corymbosa var. corymbosa]